MLHFIRYGSIWKSGGVPSTNILIDFFLIFLSPSYQLWGNTLRMLPPVSLQFQYSLLSRNKPAIIPDVYLNSSYRILQFFFKCLNYSAGLFVDNEMKLSGKLKVVCCVYSIKSCSSS